MFFFQKTSQINQNSAQANLPVSGWERSLFPCLTWFGIEMPTTASTWKELFGKEVVPRFNSTSDYCAQSDLI
jgi:hypothetical protein